MDTILFQLEEISYGKIIKRPSSICKTPYVADVLLETNESILGHTPSLGCGGLCEKESDVVLSKLKDKKTCSYRVELSYYNNTYIGMNPKTSEHIIENALSKNLLHFLKDIKDYKREVSFLKSRFDFYGHDEKNTPFIMEIKSAPLANSKKESYFPEGYRKKKGDVVSPRALKHIEELKYIKTHNVVPIRTILCFVISRSDTSTFHLAHDDIIYKEAVIDAHKNGVEIYALQVNWNEKGTCVFVTSQLPVSLNNIDFI